MKERLILPLTVMLFLVVLLPNASHAQEFSADMESMADDKKITGRLYLRPDRWRIEAEGGGRRQISIFRKDRRIIWHLAPDQKQYLEFPLKEEQMLSLFGSKVLGEVRREKVGKETINERETVKYKIHVKINDQEGILYQWVDAELNLPIRASDAEGMFFSEFTAIKVGPQEDHLFELPADFTRYAIQDKQ